MGNLKTLSILAAVAVAHATVMEPLQMAAWAALVSFSGGFAAGWRKSHRWADVLVSATNTMVMGASVVLVTSYWTSHSLQLVWGAIGLSGLLSLGGLGTVDWAIGLAKTAFGRKIKEKTDDE